MQCIVLRKLLDYLSNRGLILEEFPDEVARTSYQTYKNIFSMLLFFLTVKVLYVPICEHSRYISIKTKQNKKYS